jgi:hypothetical protein
MYPLSVYTRNSNVRGIMYSALLVTIILIISSPLKLHATQSSIYFSPSSLPAGVKSLEPLMAKWWNWWTSIPSTTASNWSTCIKGDGGAIGNNQSIVFLGNGAFAVEKNVNAKAQKCEITSNQLLYLTVYPGECSTGSKPHEGEFPDMKSPADLLKCAQDSNKVIKLMQVKVDGIDVSSNIIKESTSNSFNYVIPIANTWDFKPPIAGGNNYAMAENYYLFFKPLPVGHHTIGLEVIRVPLQANQPVEHDMGNWDINVVS